MSVMQEMLYKLIDFLRGRKQDYQLCFTSPAGQRVLQDLIIFCRGNESTFNDNDRRHALAEGRREVWLRIQNHLNLTSQQLAVLYSGQSILPTGDNL